MSHYYIKTDKDKDFYVVMSTIAGDWVFAGTAAEVAEFELEDENAPEHTRPRELIEQMLRRADVYGSSSGIGRARWDQEWVYVGMLYRLPRKDLVQYVTLSADEATDEDREAAKKLLEEDDDD